MEAIFLNDINWIIKEKGRITNDDIARLKRGEPVDYIIGFVDFLGCKIDLSQRVFIPRLETEYWVENAIKGIREFATSQNFPRISCLDIFAGSGCIGIAILKACSDIVERVDFADSQEKCLKQIKINLDINSIEDKRYRIIRSDIFSNIQDSYDFIFANPPYVAESRIDKVQQSVLNSEPHEALFAGRDGLFYIKEFLRNAKNYLNQNGKIYMEFDSWQKPAIAKIIRLCNYSNFEFFLDQYGKWRFVVVE